MVDRGDGNKDISYLWISLEYVLIINGIDNFV